MQFGFNRTVFFFIPNPPNRSLLDLQSGRYGRNQITGDFTQRWLMTYYQDRTIRNRPVNRSQNGMGAGARTYCIFGYKVRSQHHRRLLSPARRADDYPCIFRQFWLEPIRHAFCLIQPLPGQLTCGIGKTVFRFGMTPQN